MIPDFDPGILFGANADRLQFRAAAFDPGSTIGLGTLDDGVTFSVIAPSFDGTNAGVNSAFGAGLPTFIFSEADATLYYDADGLAGGYTVVVRVADFFGIGPLTAAEVEIVV
ncbi:MAG: hypothetical protein EXQ94_04855 [Alphaproteobacteria bacterium]|nr:hypothetical protein [Alphaproteobacteria bacterium]